MKKYLPFLSLILCVAVMAVVSCNKKFTRMLPDAKYTDTATVHFGERKVLYLIVDGARGASVNASNIPHIKALLPHSIYSWVSSCPGTAYPHWYIYHPHPHPVK